MLQPTSESLRWFLRRERASEWRGCYVFEDLPGSVMRKKLLPHLGAWLTLVASYDLLLSTCFGCTSCFLLSACLMITILVSAPFSSGANVGLAAPVGMTLY